MESKEARPPNSRYRALTPLLGVALMGAVILFAASCATTRPYGYTAPEPIRVARIVKWSKKGVPANVIIRRLRKSETVYRISASQIANLSQEGVPDQVLNYMQETYLRAIRRDQRLEDQNYWMAYQDGYYYGGPYYWLWPDVDFGANFAEYGHEGEEHAEHGGGGHGGHEGGEHRGYGGHGGGDHEGGRGR
jgi:uncharacterized membrane protein YgcG